MPGRGAELEPQPSREPNGLRAQRRRIAFRIAGLETLLVAMGYALRRWALDHRRSPTVALKLGCGSDTVVELA
jgi:hypothetical protein